MMLMALMMVYSCSLIPTRQIEVSAKPIDRKIVQPIMPREIDLQEPLWIVVTPDEVMAYNMQEIKRYITELKDVVVYYRKVTTTQEKENE